MKEVLAALLTALLLTLLLEGLFVLLVTRKKSFVLTSFAGNLVTNPLLNVILLAVGSSPLRLPALIALELAAVFVEALLYRYVTEKKRLRCLLLSLGANAVSYCIGGTLMRLFF